MSIRSEDIKKFPEFIQQQIRDQINGGKGKNSSNNSIKGRIDQCSVGNGAKTTNKSKKVGKTNDMPFTVIFEHYRHRLTDSDNLSEFGKWMLDSLVEKGLAEDDSTKFIKEVRHRQIKIPKEFEEHILVKIE